MKNEKRRGAGLNDFGFVEEEGSRRVGATLNLYVYNMTKGY